MTLEAEYEIMQGCSGMKIKEALTRLEQMKLFHAQEECALRIKLHRGTPHQFFRRYSYGVNSI